jgi:hypothetical protein
MEPVQYPLRTSPARKRRGQPDTIPQQAKGLRHAAEAPPAPSTTHGSAFAIVLRLPGNPPVAGGALATFAP